MIRWTITATTFQTTFAVGWVASGCPTKSSSSMKKSLSPPSPRLLGLFFSLCWVAAWLAWQAPKIRQAGEDGMMEQVAIPLLARRSKHEWGSSITRSSNE
mmetsp:Transcript_123889/g.246573  ORF Transcript_123889/g.246573 Transcript_123889/m.246573 type:complete len:100 (+) Transcript_123889:1033-1332(+)